MVNLIMMASYFQRPTLQQCPRWKVEKASTTGERKKYIYAARKSVDISTPVTASKSYTATDKVAITSIVTQTCLTWLMHI